MTAEKARELSKFPGVIGPPVDDRYRGPRPNEIERLEPDFVVHENCEDEIRTEMLDLLQQLKIEIGKIEVAAAIE